jgi:cardiolipin synthase (CMP-forming)
MTTEESPSSDISGSPERNVWLTLPNVLTLLRILAIVPFTILAARGRDGEALVLFFFTGLTDTLDGTIARRFGASSKIGRLLDPIADKLFTGVSFVVLALFRPGLSSIPLWVMFAALARDALILIGSFLVYRMSRDSGFKASLYGKLNTLLEICIVICFLASSKLPVVVKVLTPLYILLVISLLVSTADYLQTGLRMALSSYGGKDVV